MNIPDDVVLVDADKLEKIISPLEFNYKAIKEYGGEKMSFQQKDLEAMEMTIKFLKASKQNITQYEKYFKLYSEKLNNLVDMKLDHKGNIYLSACFNAVGKFDKVING